MYSNPWSTWCPSTGFTLVYQYLSYTGVSTTEYSRPNRSTVCHMWWIERKNHLLGPTAYLISITAQCMLAFISRVHCWPVFNLQSILTLSPFLQSCFLCLEYQWQPPLLSTANLLTVYPILLPRSLITFLIRIGPCINLREMLQPASGPIEAILAPHVF